VVAAMVGVVAGAFCGDATNPATMFMISSDEAAAIDALVGPVVGAVAEPEFEPGFGPGVGPEASFFIFANFSLFASISFRILSRSVLMVAKKGSAFSQSPSE